MAVKNLRQRAMAEVKRFCPYPFSYNGEESEAELHWYEARGIGKVEMKIKELFD